MIPTYAAHARAIPAEQFAEAWNGAVSLDEAARAIRGVAGGSTPRWALMARAAELRKKGISLRRHEAVVVAETAGGE